jgi:hypothetical protein
MMVITTYGELEFSFEMIFLGCVLWQFTLLSCIRTIRVSILIHTRTVFIPTAPPPRQVEGVNVLGCKVEMCCGGDFGKEIAL